MKLSYCAACEKMKAHTIPTEIKNKDGAMTKGDVCLLCSSSSDAIIKAIKGLTIEESARVVEFILNKLSKIK